MKELSIGDVVIISRPSKINSHIRNDGYIGIIEEMNDVAVQLEIFWDSNNDCELRAFGAVDIGSVDKINNLNEFSLQQKIAHSKCFNYTV